MTIECKMQYAILSNLYGATTSLIDDEEHFGVGTVRFATKSEAADEAERLSEKYPNAHFDTCYLPIFRNHRIKTETYRDAKRRRYYNRMF